MEDAWARCSRMGCRMFNVKQRNRSIKCQACDRPLRGAMPDPEADIDERLLLASKERLLKELARIDERLAELAKLKGRE